MELKDGVIYATPQGHLFSNETIQEFVERVGNAFKIISKAVQEFGKLLVLWFKKASRHVSDIFKSVNIEENQERIENDRYMRQSWRVPMKLKKSSQVANRKPLFIHARSNL